MPSQEPRFWPRRSAAGPRVGARRHFAQQTRPNNGCCPTTSSGTLPKVFVKSPTGHPYLYRKRVARFDASLRPGSLAAVCADRGNVFAYGLFNPRAEIAVRLLRWGTDRPDDAFWTEQLTHAASLRRDLLGLDAQTNAYRLVHSEGDGLSGIVVDRFGDVLSGEAFSLGMFQRGADLLERLGEIVGTRSWILRPGPASFDQEAFEAPPLQSVRRAGRRHDSGIRHAIPRQVRRQPQDRVLLRSAREPSTALRRTAPANRCSTCAATPAALPCRPKSSATRPK